MATLRDVEQLALELPETTKELAEGRPRFLVEGRDIVVDAWLARAPKRLAKEWLAG